MKSILASITILLAACVAALAQNTVSFDNQSGEPALVKLVGPTSNEIEVPNGAKQGVQASAGRYIIKVRYGTADNYHYAKGGEFDVKETTTTRSEITITLHKVVAGNYESQPISEKDFLRDLPKQIAGGNAAPVTSTIQQADVRVVRVNQQFDNLHGRTFAYVGGQVLKKASDDCGRQVHLEVRGGALSAQGRPLGLSALELLIFLDYDQAKGQEEAKAVSSSVSSLARRLTGQNRLRIVDAQGAEYAASEESPNQSLDALVYSFYIKGSYKEPLTVVLPWGRIALLHPEKE